MMGFLTDHPYTAVTANIDRVVSNREYSLEVELAEIVDLIGFRNTVNQEEAARALRKKLKYGSKVQQSRSLDLLDLLLSQELKFGVIYNDDKLLDRLEVIALNRDTDGNGVKYNPAIVSKAAKYEIQWYEHIASIGKKRSKTFGRLTELGSRVKREYRHKQSSSPRRRADRRNAFLDDEADPFESLEDDNVTTERNRGNASTDADRLYRIPQIDIRKHAPKIKLIISDALAASVALKHSLLTLPADKYSTDDMEATDNFIKARKIRKKVLAYLQVVTEGEFLGSLIQANDELVASLTEYDEKSDKAEHDTREDRNDGNDSDDVNESVDYEYSDDDADEVSRADHSIYSVPQSTASNPFGDQNHL